MLALALILLSTLAAVNGQASILIEGAGAVPGAAAQFFGAGVGDEVDGYGAAVAEPGYAASIVQVVAEGDGKYNGKGDDDDDDDDDDDYKPYPKPDKKPAPQPYPKPAPKPGKNVYYPVPAKTYYTPVCEDIKDDKCGDIEKYDKCGYCVVEPYGDMKGYGCSYYEEKQFKEKPGKKDYDVDIVIKPTCKCDGAYIIYKDECPYCDKLLALLLECAGAEDDKDTVEVPEKCLTEYDIDIKYLIKCGYVEDPDKPKQADKAPKPIVIKKEKEEPKYPYGKPSASATASAYATAIGGGSAYAASDAYAAAFGGKGGAAVASANAVAVAGN